MWNYVPKHKNYGIFGTMTGPQMARILIEGVVLGVVIVTALVLWL